MTLGAYTQSASRGVQVKFWVNGGNLGLGFPFLLLVHYVYYSNESIFSILTTIDFQRMDSQASTSKYCTRILFASQVVGFMGMDSPLAAVFFALLHTRWGDLGRVSLESLILEVLPKPLLSASHTRHTHTTCNVSKVGHVIEEEFLFGCKEIAPCQ